MAECHFGGGRNTEATAEWHFGGGFEPLPKCYSAVARRLPFLRPPPKRHSVVATAGNCSFFVQDLLLISSIVCCLLSMLQPRLIVYIVNKDL